MSGVRQTVRKGEPLWLAHLVHRWSGLALAIFIPFHVVMLSQALLGANHFDATIGWTNAPVFKIAEWGLVFLLALHMFGGLRLMAFELLGWTNHQKTLAAAMAALSFAVSLLFLLAAFS